MTGRLGWFRSVGWAAGICLPLCLWGASASMALVHSGGAFALLFLPVIPVIVLFGSDGPLGEIPEWMFYGLATGAEFLGILLVVHGVRILRARRRENDA